MSVLSTTIGVASIAAYTVGMLLAGVLLSQNSQDISDGVALDVAQNRVVGLSNQFPPILGQKRVMVATGFNIKSKSGKVFTVTNNHVCDGSKTGKVDATDEMGNKKELAIVSRSDTDDLCLLEPFGTDAYSLAPMLLPREPVHCEGHPHGYPLIIQRGRLVGTHDIEWSKPVDPGDENSCPQRAYQEPVKIPDIMSMLQSLGSPEAKPSSPLPMITLCHIHLRGVLLSSNSSFPGSSGSPLLNNDGEIVGVVFAIDDFGFTESVPLDHVRKLLDNY